MSWVETWLRRASRSTKGEVDGAGEGGGEAEVAEHEGYDSAFALAPYGVALGDCHVVGFQGRRIWLLGRCHGACFFFPWFLAESIEN